MDRKSITLATVVLIVVGAILFKDTIAHIMGTSSSIDEPRASLQRSTPAFESNRNRPVSPLSRVLAAFDTKKVDTDKFPGVIKKREDQNIDVKRVSKPATWPMLQQGQYREILISARNRSLIIASQLKDDTIRSKYALFNFAGGVDFVLSQPSNVLSVPEAMSYLEDLHLKATRSLEEDGVKKEIYKTWRDVSLDATRAVDRMKEGGDPTIGPANPDSDLSIFIVKITTKKNSPYMKVKGAVRGENVDRIEVYRNGIYLFNVLRGRPRKGYIPIFFKYHDGTGIWAIRVVSQTGEFFERRYRFLGYAGGPVNMRPYATKRFILPGGDWVPF